MFDFSCHLPINNLSFGNCSVALLREFHKKGLQPTIFPLGGQVDLSSQVPDVEFGKWLESCINKRFYAHKRDNPCFSLWHLNDMSLSSFGKKQALFSFHETDSPTKEEINIAKNQDKLIFSSDYSCNIFKDVGVNNIEKISLGFDNHNFKVINKRYFQDNRIVFNVVGKYERRKSHLQLIRAWTKRFGNNPRYFLQCGIYNGFLRRQVNGQIIDDNEAHVNQIMEGKKFFNISFLPFMQSNAAYNDFLNSGNIVIAMSGAEAWGLPEMHSVGLGKHSVVLNCTGYKEWCNESNSVLVSPNGKADAADGMFFQKGNIVNQGQIYTFDDEAFLEGCEKAIKRVEANPINTAGLELQKKFTFEKTADKILEVLENL